MLLVKRDITDPEAGNQGCQGNSTQYDFVFFKHDIDDVYVVKVQANELLSVVVSGHQTLFEANSLHSCVIPVRTPATCCFQDVAE